MPGTVDGVNRNGASTRNVPGTHELLLGQTSLPSLGTYVPGTVDWMRWEKRPRHVGTKRVRTRQPNHPLRACRGRFGLTPTLRSMPSRSSVAGRNEITPV